jgi:hypothetical protein
VLGALEAADPDFDLLSHLGPMTLPADSVKALFRNPGLVRRVRYRPSARTQLAARTSGLTGAELDAVERLAGSGDAPELEAMATGARVRVIDAALDLVDVRHGRDIVVNADAAADALRQKLLEKRSAIRVPSAPLAIMPPSAGGPERGHASLRLGFGAIASRDNPSGAVLEGRLALHDLTDPPAGFSPRTQIEFFKTRLTLADRRRALHLEDASIVEVTSLNPLDRFERRVSWKMRLGATRVADSGCTGCIAGLFTVGGGPGFVSAEGAFSAALTADAELLGAPDLHGFSGAGVRPGVGPGVLLRLLGGDRAALLGTATWRYLPLAAPATSYDLGVEGRVHFGAVSLAARLRKAPLAQEASLVLLWYAR